MDAIYARQSVDKADSLSIQGQIDLCKEQASEDFKVYQDKGYSGKNTNRPAFQRLMAALAESTDVIMGYINRTIQRLEDQRVAPEEQVRQKTKPCTNLTQAKI